ncbi:MAG: stage II sporulation protein R, partial [Clostridia bacterium]|nr:stage II sporulation protein R [Clostridia bacterium]
MFHVSSFLALCAFFVLYIISQKIRNVNNEFSLIFPSIIGKRRSVMRGLLIFTSLVLIIAVCGAVFPVRGEVGLYDRMIRLHVIANSDSPEDQELKLAV